MAMAAAAPAMAEMALADESAEEEGADDSSGQSIRARLNFDPLALFAPEVHTDQDGRASVQVTLPDNLTRYRVMVVAVAGGRFFGAGESADAVSAHLQDAFCGLARTGSPRTEAMADWEPYDTQSRSTGIFVDPVEVAHAPYDEERTLWVGREVSLPFGPSRR